MCVNGGLLIFELKRSIRQREIQIRFIERSDCSNVFPIPVKQMDMDVMGPDRHRKDFLSEILVIRFRQQLDQGFDVKEINSHAGEAITSMTFDSSGIDPSGVGPDHQIDFFVSFWLFQKPTDATGVVDSHDSETPRRFARDGQGGDGRVGA